MPVTSEMPIIKATIIEVPTEKHPRDVRGAGEVPIVPPMARLRMPFAPPQVCAWPNCRSPTEGGGGGHDSHKLTAELINNRSMMYC